MAVITIASVALTGWHGGSSVELRIYANATFTSSTNVIIQEGAPGYGFYATFTCSVAGTTLTISSGTLHSTTDARDLRTTRYQAYFYNPTTGALIQPYNGFTDFALPETPTSTDWDDILAYNRANIPFPIDYLTYSRTEILNLIANGMGIMTGQLPIASGGTAAATAAQARINLGLTGVNTEFTALQGLSAQDALMLNPFGTSAGNTSELRFYELAASGTNYVGLKAPDATSTNYILTLPTNTPTSGQMVTAGTPISQGGATVIPLSFTSPPGMGSGYNTIQEEGSSLTQQTTLNFIGASLTATNNGGSSRTDVTLSQSPAGATSVVGTTRTLTGGTGINAIGDLSADRTISLANTAVTPGSYTLASITVDAQGRLTAASSGTETTAYRTVQEEGSSLTQRATINFIGAALTAADNSGSSRTDVTLSASPNSASVVGVGRLISNGTGITGGGDLSADRTLSVVADTTVQKVEAAQAGTLVGTGRKRLNFIATGGAAISVSDNAGTNSYDITVNAGSGGAAGYTTIAEEGSSVTQRNTLNFIGAALTAADNSGSSRTDVTLSQSPASASVVGTGRTLTGGTGINAIGDLSADRTISLANTAVSPGSYTLASITVDAQGRLTAASSGATPAAYATVAEEGSSLTQRAVLNFVGGAITATDNAGSSRTDVTLSISPVGSTSVVGVGRILTAGTGLTGLGDLSADRTVSVVADTTIQKVELAAEGTLVGTGRKRINFIQGSGAVITVTENTGQNRYDVTIAASGSGGGTVTGTGTTNTLGKFTSGSAIGNSSITDNGAAVSISLPTNVAATLSTSGQFTSTYVGAGAPIVVSSTNPVSNLTLAADSQLPTISTAGKVQNSATTATTANTASAIVARDVSGNFSAGTITAALNGNASTATSAVTAGSATTATSATTAGTATNFSGSLSGDITGTQGATTYNGTLPPTKGGTSFTSYTTGEMIWANSASTLAKVTPNSTATAQALMQTSSGAPTWTTLSGSMMSAFTNDYFIPTVPLTVSTANFASGNQVRVFKFTLDIKVIVNSVHLRIGTGAAGANISVGLYDEPGTTKVLDSGLISATTAGTKAQTISATTLNPGVYWLAWTTTSAIVQGVMWGTAADLSAVRNSGTVAIGTAANASSGGVLPTTLGTITATDVAVPVCKFQN